MTLPAGAGDDLCSTTEPGRTWQCCGNTWSGMGGRWNTDRDSMFVVAPKAKQNENEWRQADRLTQIGRAVRELGIRWIAALSPQAKGRVERSFGTDQERLVEGVAFGQGADPEAAQSVVVAEDWA